MAARSEVLAGALIPPDERHRLHRLSLARGVLATAAIEGNTLTEPEVLARLAGRRDLPRSRAYLGIEIDNLLAAYNEVAKKAVAGQPAGFDRQQIQDWNRRILGSLEAHAAEGARPGELRTHSVGVGRYRAPPAEDCGYLLDRLASWLHPIPDSAAFHGREDRMMDGILRGIVAHLYIAWIHPFGDGNGRVARLAEFAFLSQAGMPTPACHLLANHYNLTRQEYYRQLDRSSRVNRGRGDHWEFVRYALRGLLDGLKEQGDAVEAVQTQMAWLGFLHERIGGRPSPARERRTALARALGASDAPLSKRELLRHPDLAAFYARRTPKTLTRDLNWLADTDRRLVERSGNAYRARTDLLRSLRPARAPATGEAGG